MRNKLTLALGWLAATALSIAIAGAAVGSVRNNVTDRPSRLAQPEAVAADRQAPTLPTEAPIDRPGSTTVPGRASDQGTTTSRAPAPETTTTTAAEPAVTPTTTAAAAPATTAAATTTTAAPVEWQLATYETTGGWVRVRYNNQTVELHATGPAPGFTSHVEKAGPRMVEVEFEDEDDREYSISVKIEDGRLEVDIEPDG
jgi:hypothetical protein